jgi:hypothetical protein
MNNEQGMSLVSMMVAIGLTGVLAVILMNLSEQQNKQHKKSLLDGELTEVYAQFNLVINQRDSCGSTFIGLQKGDTLKEFRYSFDANQDPFAEVGKPFRSTTLILKSMKILTDAEMTAKNIPIPPKDKQGYTNAVLEIVMEKPEGTLGGRENLKRFDVPVAIGKGEIIKMADPNAIESNCKTITSNRGCIASFDTGICPNNAMDAMVNAGIYYFGYCVDPKPSNPQEEIILRCTTSV